MKNIRKGFNTLRVRMHRVSLVLLISVKLGNALVFAQTAWIPEGPTGNFGSNSQPNVNGRIRSIQILPAGNDYYVYVGASSGGIWRALGSNGPVWSSLGDGLPNPAVGAFAVHPDNPDNILVGTGDWGRYAGIGMFSTMNAGQTWTKEKLPVSPHYFFQICYLPGNSNVILAASDDGLLRWEAGPGIFGAWNVVLTGRISDLVIHPTNPNILYCCHATSAAGNDGGVYRSDDAGKTWRLITAPYAPAGQISNSRIAICRKQPNILAFAFEWSGTIKGIRKSTDGGGTWTTIDCNGCLGYPNDFGGQAWHALAIAIKPDNPDWMYVGANELWRTIDGGHDWKNWWDWNPSKSAHPHQDYSQLYFSPSSGDNDMWECNDGGVYRYPVDGTIASSWNGDWMTGLRVVQVADMDAKLDFRVIGLQDDGVVSWQYGAKYTGYIGYRCCDVYNVVITNADDPTFFYSMDGSVTKQKYLGQTTPVSNQSQPLYNNEHGHLVYDRFTDKIYTLTGDGASIVSQWVATAGTDWNAEVQLPNKVSALSGNYLSGQILFVWGDQPGLLTVLGKNSGSWTVTRSSWIGGIIRGRNYSIQSVFSSTERPGECWAGLSNSGGTQSPGGSALVMHTTDNWQTWNELGGLPNKADANPGQVTAISVMPFNPRIIFVGTDVGVFWSQDGGVNWLPLQTGLPRVQCTGLLYIIDPTHVGNDKLVVSTFGRGLYECTFARQGIVYVNPRLRGLGDGTFEHPYFDFDTGFSKTPDGGILALHGDVYSVPQILNKPMTIHSYESTVKLTR